MRFGAFEQEFLVAAYQEQAFGSISKIRAGDLIDRYPLRFTPGWIHQLVGEYGQRGLFIGKGVMGDERDQPVRLTPEGMRRAEQLIDQGIAIFRIEDEDGSQNDGSDYFAKLVPASDRIVSLSHNASYTDAIEKLEIARQAISDSNVLDAHYKLDSLTHIEAGISLVMKAKNASVGAIRYLILDRLRGALESSIEEAFKIALSIAVTALLAYVISLI